MADRYVTSTAAGGGDGSASTPWTIVEAQAGAAAGDVVHVKAGTYTLAASFTPANAGTQRAPIVWRGYTTTPGDATTPVVILDANGGDYDVCTLAQTWHALENFAFTGNPTRNRHGVNATGAGCRLARCRAYNVGKIGFYAGTGEGIGFIGCTAEQFGQLAAADGFQLSTQCSYAIGCLARNGIGRGFLSFTSFLVGILRCISAGNSAEGFYVSSTTTYRAAILSHCIAYGNGAAGVYSASATSNKSLLLANCLIVGNTGYGVASHATGKGHVILAGVGFHGNTSGQYDANTVITDLGLVTLAATPFVDAANADFRLAATVGDALNAGYPAEWIEAAAMPAPSLGAIEPAARPVTNPWSA